MIGEIHPKYAISLDDVASQYEGLGNFERAEPLFCRALDIRKESSGEVVQTIPIVCINWLVLYCDMERLQAGRVPLRPGGGNPSENLGGKSSQFCPQP